MGGKGRVGVGATKTSSAGQFVLPEAIVVCLFLLAGLLFFVPLLQLKGVLGQPSCLERHGLVFCNMIVVWKGRGMS